MKALDIIKCIRETDDTMSTKLLEDLFMYAYIKGVNRGYDTALKLIKNEAIFSDIEEARRLFIKKYK